MNIKKKYTHKIISVNLKNKQSRKKNNYQFRESNPLELKLTNIPQQNILIGGTPSQGDINFPTKLNIPKKSINFDTQGISETNESLTNLLAGEKKKLVGKYQMVVVSKNREGSFEIFSVKPSKKLEVEQEGGMQLFGKKKPKTAEEIAREKALEMINKLNKKKKKEPSSFFGKKPKPLTPAEKAKEQAVNFLGSITAASKPEPSKRKSLFGKKPKPLTPAEKAKEQAVNFLGGIAAASKPEPSKGKSLFGKEKKKTSFLDSLKEKALEAAQKDKKKTSFLDSLKEKALEAGKKGMEFAEKTAQEITNKADEVASDPKIIEQIRATKEAATSAATSAASTAANVASAATTAATNVASSAASTATTATAVPANSGTTSPSEPTTSSAITTANTTKSSSSDNSTSDDSLINNEYIFDIYELESKGEFIKISFKRLDKKINGEPEKSFLFLKKIEDYFQIFGGDFMLYIGDFLQYPHRLIITQSNGQEGGSQLIESAKRAALEKAKKVATKINPELVGKAEEAVNSALQKVSETAPQLTNAAKQLSEGNIEGVKEIGQQALEGAKAAGQKALETASSVATSAVENATGLADSSLGKVQSTIEATKSKSNDSSNLNLPLSEQELESRREKMTNNSQKALTDLEENKGELPDEGDVGEGNDEGEQGDERVEGEEDEEGEEVEESEEEGEEGEKGSKQGKKKGSKNGEGEDGEGGDGDGDLEARVSKLENMLKGIKNQLAIEPKDSEKCVNVTIPDCDDDNTDEQENEDAHIKHKNMVQLSKILRVMEANEDRSSLYTFIKGNDNMYEWVPTGQADSNLCNLGLLFQRLMILSALPLNNKEKTLFSSICKNLNGLEDEISERNKLAITLEALDIED